MSTQPEFDIPQFTVGDRLRKAREHAGMEQTELAEAIGMSRASVSNNERGTVSPRLIVLKAWALATGVPLEWIRFGTVPPNSGPLD